MPVNDDLAREIIDNILDQKQIEEAAKRLESVPISEKPLPRNIPRQASWSKEDQDRRIEHLKKMGIEFEYVTGKKEIKDPQIFKGNIENYIGTAQMPIGVIGPLRINGIYAKGDFFIPMATTEGVLVASYNRGAKAISLAGGARTICLTERVSRAPGFRFKNLIEAGKFVIWLSGQIDHFKKIVSENTRHGALRDVFTTLEGNYVFLNFEYTTGDASGQNMVTICTDAVCQYILKTSPVKPKQFFIESNLSGDKKATSMSYLFARGKKVTAEVTISEKICRRILHTTPEKVIEYAKMSIFGATQSGTFGIQGHYANALAAIFIACGQDAACVSESHVGITNCDIDEEKNLYFSITMPNLIVGTIGGGTGLPTQSECLKMLGCKGTGTARKFAEICAVTVLAGEISIIGAISSGEFTQAHVNYARNK